ncbi:DUF333 domain-containing protein [Winslowiella iniecta]|uniref:Hemolysin n=1 Tax=Winslowiella iniecta TaxID=1560201 RepID=A0A0L7SX81_9GAMM|nr:DUF333 domain-containing protein [Winslowiella iniecta]KOC87685.1 hypothetical protein NG42_19390 [Winslowiella iniecta]KOC89857.1 hypothetical protein NG43_17965 [Winslowiella iniecta]
MKKLSCLMALTLLAGCTTQREAPPPPNSIRMANPASVYCQQKGGKSENIQTTQGVRSDCLLPGGERIDEWALYRRDHQ